MKLIIALLLSLPLLTRAGDKITFAASSSSGTYKAMLGEVVELCSSDDGPLKIELAPDKGGATENLDALSNNRVSAAFLHSDVIYAMAQAEPKYRELKVLVSLYPEDIHVVALRNSKTKTGGWKGLNAKTVEFNNLADLKGFKVGAAGGGCITARVLTGQGEGHFGEVVCLDSGKELIPALDKAEVDAVIFVGGAPLELVEKLSPQYKLLPIPDSMGAKLSGIYRPTTINYVNVKSGAVKTLAPEAVVLTRKYTIQKLVSPQAAFRRCFYEHLEEIQQTPGKHPKWQAVENEADASSHSVWEWYQLPKAVTPTTAPEPAKVATKKKRA